MGNGLGFVKRYLVRLSILAALGGTLGVLALSVSGSESGDAAFPGANGRIAYSAGAAYVTSIWTANADGSAPTQLTTGNSDYGPSYSSNGSRIAFGRENGIAVMNADGSGQTLLSPGSESNSSSTEWEAEYDDPHSSKVIPFVKITTYKSIWDQRYAPTFSPDGSQLAAVERKGMYIAKFICGVEALEDTECISGYGSSEGSYFNYEEDCIGCISHIVTINSTSGAVTGEVTPPSNSYEDYGPAYAANGALAFTRWESGGSRILVIGSPGGPAVPVTPGPNDSEPNFSPDSSKIAYIHGNEIALVGVGGGPATVLPALPLPAGTTKSYVQSPAFSPDGTRVTFQRVAYGPSGKIEGGVFTMGVDGSGLTKVVSDAYGPDWQPLAPPVPPTPVTAKAKKGKVRLNRKNEAVIGTITCGSSPCKLKVLSALLKIREGKSKKGKHGKASTAGASKKGKGGGSTVYKVKGDVPKTLGPGKKGKVKVKVQGKALKALSAAGKGALTIKIKVTEGLGKKVVTMKSTLLPPKPAKKPKKHHK